MTPTEVQELKLLLAGLTSQIKSMSAAIDRMHASQFRLFQRLDATEKQLSTLQGEHNIKKNSCGTDTKGNNSGMWASVVRAVARSKVVSVCLAVVAIAVLIILLKYWGMI